MQLVREAAEGLDAARALGPFFAAGPPRSGHVVRDWPTAGDILARPEVLRRRVEVTRQLLGAGSGVVPEAVDVRTAASLTGLGLFARIVSPVLGGALLSGVVPVMGPIDWLLGPPGPGPGLVVARPRGGVRCHAPDDLAAAVVEHCIQPVIVPLVELIAATYALSHQVLWGNATSALAGAARMCRRTQPELALPAAATVEALLQREPLARTGAWVRPDPARPRWFLTRRSCCLLYRLPGATPCGDCILLPPVVRRQQWAEELLD